MSENENPPVESAPADATVDTEVTTEVTEEIVVEPIADVPPVPSEEMPPVPPEEITYHAVEKDGQVTAIWEMQGRKHVRTIDPRSHQGQDILRLYTSDHHEDVPAPESSDAAAV